MKTIVYHKPTGKILALLPYLSIHHRATLLEYVEGYPLSDLAYFYEQNPINVSMLKDHIERISHNNPPMVVTSSGRSKSFLWFINNRRNAVQNSESVLCHFEGGMGDQLLQAAAALQFYEIYPTKKITLSVNPRFHAVIAHVPGLREAYPRDALPKHLHADTVLDMHTQYISDPRGGLFGKASLYGASIGLKKVIKQASLLFTPAQLARSILPISPLFLDSSRLKIGIHIRSSSGHAKSWHHEAAEALALKFIHQHKAAVALIGHAGDFNLDNPAAVHITDRYTWHQTATVIAALNLLVCIDSGPMHIAHSLGVLTLILWGGTTFRDILGRTEQLNDLRKNLPCMDQICYSCPRGDNACMTTISPEEVYDRAQQILFPPPAPATDSHRPDKRTLA